MALATIDEALKRIRRGEMVLVVDDEDRENEGDLTMAASWVTPRGDQLHAALGARASSACRATPSRLDELDIWPMVPPDRAGCDTAFTVSIDHVDAGSGIGAADRATTIRARPRSRSSPRATSSAPGTCSRCAPVPAACSSGAATPRPRSTSPGSPASRRSR